MLDTCKRQQDTQNPSCLKQFLDQHGLSLLWIFMVELSEAKGSSSNNVKLQLEVRGVFTQGSLASSSLSSKD